MSEHKRGKLRGVFDACQSSDVKKVFDKEIVIVDEPGNAVRASVAHMVGSMYGKACIENRDEFIIKKSRQ